MCGVRMTLSNFRSARLELLVVALGLDGKHVDGGAGEMAALQRVGQRVDVHHGAARGVDEVGARLHGGELGAADQVFRLRRLGHVQGDDIALAEQGGELGDGARVAEREPAGDVVVEHAHAQVLGEDAELRADVAVADDAERLAAHLDAALGALGPAAAVHERAFPRDAAQQHDGLAEHELGDAAGVGVGGVEDRDAALRRRREVHLVGPDAEAADGGELWRRRQHLLGQFGARADAEEVHVLQRGLQGVAREGLRQVADGGIAVGRQRAGGVGVDALEEEELDAALVEGEFLHRSADFQRKARAGQGPCVSPAFAKAMAGRPGLFTSRWAVLCEAMHGLATCAPMGSPRSPCPRAPSPAPPATC
jgi:hypothetical protein